MSDTTDTTTNTTPPAPAPAAPAAPPAQPATPAPAATGDGGADIKLTSQQLAARLAETRVAALREAGFATLDDAKAAHAAAKAAADAKKTAEQRAADAAAELAATKATVAAKDKVITEYAARMMVGLAPEQAAAVKAIAGEDPALVVQTITALAPTWAKAPPPAGAQPPAAPPANTAPPRGAPSDAQPATTNTRATYERLAKANPFIAAAYSAEHPEVFDKT